MWTAARNTATQNGADVNQVTCKVIRRDQSEIANCSPSIGWILDGLLGGPAGVKVTTGITNLTAFGKVLNTSSLTARATAAAQVKPLVSAKGAPFIVCGVGDHTLSKTQWTQDQTNGVSNNPDLLSLPINLLLPSGAVNPLAVGHIYGLQGSGSTISDCGIESAFDGKSANGNTGIPIPSWQTGTNGNGNDSAVFDTVAGAKPCDGATGFNNCDLVLPLADSGTSGYQLHVVALAVFHVTGTGSGNPKYAGRLLTTTAPVTARRRRVGELRPRSGLRDQDGQVEGSPTRARPSRAPARRSPARARAAASAGASPPPALYSWARSAQAAWASVSGVNSASY